MKRIVKCLCLLLVCTVCFCCVSGCNSQTTSETVDSNQNSEVSIDITDEKFESNLLSEIPNDDIINALQENGFDAYIYDKATDNGIINTIIIDKNDTCTISRIRDSDKNVCYMIIENISENTKTEEILKAVFPLFGINVMDTEIKSLLSLEDENDDLGLSFEDIDNKVFCMYDAERNRISVWDTNDLKQANDKS